MYPATAREVHIWVWLQSGGVYLNGGWRSPRLPVPTPSGSYFRLEESWRCSDRPYTVRLSRATS